MVAFYVSGLLCKGANFTQGEVSEQNGVIWANFQIRMKYQKAKALEE